MDKIVTGLCFCCILSAISFQAAPLWSESYGVQTEKKPQGNSGICVAGKRVEILYADKWYPGVVQKGPDQMGTCLVAYDGYGSNWDEWVSLQRLRTSASANNSTTSNRKPSPSPVTSPTRIPNGLYNCYTFDNGQLNYTYTDIVIESDTRYSTGPAGGTYKLQPSGSISFTGTLSDTNGTFSIKNSGKAEIGLIFNNDALASMICTHRSQ